MAISCTIDANITEPGEIVVSAKHISELVRKLSAETVTISKNQENKTIKVASGNSEYQLLLMNEDDYPKFPDFNGDKSITIADDKIKELIRKTIFSCSNDEARPLFTGILVESKDDKLTFVGTNTHRLAVKFISQPTQENLSMIIPSKVLNEIARNLTSDMPQEVKISLLNNQIMVIIDDVIIVSRLIEGKFPDYNKVIPAKFAVKCTVKAKELAGAVERAEMFLADGDWDNADTYCEKVLDMEPKNGTAYLYKLMADLDVSKKEDLENCTDSFDTSNNYQKAIRFGDEALRNTLEGYITHIKQRKEDEENRKREARLNGIYTAAQQRMSTAKFEADYKDAAEMFATVPNYRDADKLHTVCMDTWLLP